MSQAQLQEIEKLRKRYFQSYDFLGYRLFNGEMIEGFHICEHDVCRYISGYAQFYEKNDSMLAYMLDVREEMPPETVDQEKYNEVKKRQEERRIQHEEGRQQTRRMRNNENAQDRGGTQYGDSRQQAGETRDEEERQAVRRMQREQGRRTARGMQHGERRQQKESVQGETQSIRGMRIAVVGVFALLCLVGLSALNGNDKVQDLQTAARQAMDNAMEQRLPDAVQTTGEAIGVDTLITEDKLADAVKQENDAAEQATPSGSAQPADLTETTPTAATEAQGQAAEQNTTSTQNAAPTQETASTQNAAPTQEITSTQNPAPTQESASTQNPAPTQEITSTQNPASAQESSPAQDAAPVQEQKSQQEPESAQTSASKPQPVSYTIKDGDTLIGISFRNYGTDKKVSEICALNKINDPDDIKSGQKILLP